MLSRGCILPETQSTGIQVSGADIWRNYPRPYLAWQLAMSEIASPVKTSQVTVAGINVNIFSYTELSKAGRPIAVLFILHGRLESANSVEGIAHQILAQANSQGSTNKDLLIVTIVIISL